MNISPPKKSEILWIVLMFFKQKLITNVIFNKTKNTRVVAFFIYMYSMCVQLFTAFEVPVLHFYVT